MQHQTTTVYYCLNPSFYAYLRLHGSIGDLLLHGIHWVKDEKVHFECNVRKPMLGFVWHWSTILVIEHLLPILSFRVQGHCLTVHLWGERDPSLTHNSWQSLNVLYLSLQHHYFLTQDCSNVTLPHAVLLERLIYLLYEHLAFVNNKWYIDWYTVWLHNKNWGRITKKNKKKLWSTIPENSQSWSKCRGLSF